MALVYILNGPNLNLLGKRQPEIYGHETLADVERDCRALGLDVGHETRFFQSNAEHELVEMIHGAREDGAAIIINAGAFTHTSVAILDALNAFDGIVVELHISQVHRREAFRHHSYIAARADAIIAGCGTLGYQLALRHVAHHLAIAAS
ncbi:MAG: type II 3-dehydroquinate dehydratase [Pseudomonadota bacterium]